MSTSGPPAPKRPTRGALWAWSPKRPAPSLRYLMLAPPHPVPGGRSGVVGHRTTGSPGSAECGSWSPRDGHAALRGQPWRDVVLLRDVTLTQLVGGIDVYDMGMSLNLNRDDSIGFIDAQGEPACFSGELRVDGATLRFFDVAVLRLA